MGTSSVVEAIEFLGVDEAGRLPSRERTEAVDSRDAGLAVVSGASSKVSCERVRKNEAGGEHEFLLLPYQSSRRSRA